MASRLYWPRPVTIFGIRPIIVMLAALTVLCAYMGWLPAIDDDTKALLRPPGTATPSTLSPSTSPSSAAPIRVERDEALLLAFFCVFVAPFAVLVFALFMIFAIDVASGIVRPLTRALRLPDAIARTSAAGGWIAAIYLARPYWLPGWSWMFEVLTRAYQVVLT